MRTQQTERTGDEGAILRPFKPSDLDPVRELIHSTIDSSYSGFYPPRAVEYFKQYHSSEAILARADEGHVVVIEDAGRIVATGALLDGEICGVFVAPECQGRGLGGLMMDELEAVAPAFGTRTARLNVSLPSRGFYERRDYRLSERYSHHVGEGQYLDYWEGEKDVMKCSIRPIAGDDREAIVDILNHYIKHSFAAFRQEPVPYEWFDALLQSSAGYPTAVVSSREGEVVGFGFLQSHGGSPTLAQTAEITYFLHPDHTGRGLGTLLLTTLEHAAAERGITNLLADICSLNDRSISFHEKNGFVECGRLKRVGRKMGREFDTVWMQKLIDAS